MPPKRADTLDEDTQRLCRAVLTDDPKKFNFVQALKIARPKNKDSTTNNTAAFMYKLYEILGHDLEAFKEEELLEMAVEQAGGTENNYWAALCVFIPIMGYGDLPVNKYVHDKCVTAQHTRRTRDMRQDLQGNEQFNYVFPEEIKKNHLLLIEREKLYPSDISIHQQRLLYDFWTIMGPRTCVFRLDIITDCTMCFQDQADNIDTHAKNFIQFSPFPTRHPAKLHLNNFKNIKWQGSKILELPMELTQKLAESYNMFPRKMLFVRPRKNSSEPMSSPDASKMMKNSWILDKRKPGADILRSVFITCFLINEPKIQERMQYMDRSNTSMGMAEINYNKTSPEVRERMLREAPLVVDNWRNITLTDEEKALARRTRKRKVEDVTSTSSDDLEDLGLVSRPGPHYKANFVS